MADLDDRPVVRDHLPQGHVRGRRRRESPPIALRYGATQYPVHVARRPLQDHADDVDRAQGRLVPLLGRPRDDRVPRAATWATTRYRSRTSGPTRSPPARSGPEVPTAEPEPEPEPTPHAGAAAEPRLSLRGSVRRRLSPQRQLEPEARVGVIERVAEQLAQPTEPVARRLRVDRRAARATCPAAPARQARPRSVSVSRARDPGEQRRKRRQPVGGELAGEQPVAAQQQLARALARDDQRRRRPRAARAPHGRARS